MTQGHARSASSLIRTVMLGGHWRNIGSTPDILRDSFIIVLSCSTVFPTDLCKLQGHSYAQVSRSQSRHSAQPQAADDSSTAKNTFLDPSNSQAQRYPTHARWPQQLPSSTSKPTIVSPCPHHPTNLNPHHANHTR